MEARLRIGHDLLSAIHGVNESFGIPNSLAGDVPAAVDNDAAFALLEAMVKGL